jgi:hypothetical protein
MFRRIFLIGIPLLILIAGLIYSRLGGFNDPEISVLSISELHFYGRSYEGRYRSDEIEKLFYDVKDQLPSGNYLTIINYPVDEEDTVKYFVGSTRLKTGIQWDTLILEQYPRLIRFEFKKHNLVMPKPYRVFEMAEKYAFDKALILNGISIETYRGERDVVIDFLVESDQ